MVTIKDLDVKIGAYFLQRLLNKEASRAHTGMLMHFVALEYIASGDY